MIFFFSRAEITVKWANVCACHFNLHLSPHVFHVLAMQNHFKAIHYYFLISQNMIYDVHLFLFFQHDSDSKTKIINSFNRIRFLGPNSAQSNRVRSGLLFLSRICVSTCPGLRLIWMDPKLFTVKNLWRGLLPSLQEEHSEREWVGYKGIKQMDTTAY